MIITFGTEDPIDYKRDVLQNLSGERVALRYENHILTETFKIGNVLETEVWSDTNARFSLLGITSIEIEV